VVVVIAFTIGIVVSFSDTLPELLFSLSVAYALSGYVYGFVRALGRRRAARAGLSGPAGRDPS
jgi:hypothetical protein